MQPVKMIDRMLRAHLLVDLHAILKRTVRAGVEQYSLKALEVLHDFERKVDLDDARKAMRRMQHGNWGMRRRLTNRCAKPWFSITPTTAFLHGRSALGWKVYG